MRPAAEYARTASWLTGDFFKITRWRVLPIILCGAAYIALKFAAMGRHLSVRSGVIGGHARHHPGLGGAGAEIARVRAPQRERRRCAPDRHGLLQVAGPPSRDRARATA